MNKSVAIIIILLSSLQGYSQNNIFVSGIVTNKNSGQPLLYASVGVVNQPIGTVTNSNGEFEFTIPANMGNDSLFISSIGFKTYKEKISTLVKNGTKTFHLEEQAVILGEVVISDRKITAKDVVQAALAAVPSVYPTEEYIMEGFYRTWERIEFVDSATYPGTLSEAALHIYDPGYGAKAKKVNEDIYITELRRSALKKTWSYQFNYLTNILSKNEVKYPQHGSHFGLLERFTKLTGNLEYTFEGTTKMDDEEVIIVKVVVKNERNFPAYYKVFVSQNDSAILRFELHGEKEQTNFAYDYNVEDIEHLYVFKRFNNKVYLNYAKVKWTTEKADRVKKKLLQHEYYFSELLINNIITSNVKSTKEQLGKKAKSNTGLELQAGEYNESFWKNYNIIKKNPLDKDIQAHFERDASLEDQYRNAVNETKNKSKTTKKEK